MKSTNNKRLDAVIITALQSDLSYPIIALDGYNNRIATDIVYTITTRTFGDNNHFLMEIYEEDYPDKCNG